MYIVLLLHFHCNLKIIFRKLNHVLIQGALAKLQSSQLFPVDYTDCIEVS